MTTAADLSGATAADVTAARTALVAYLQGLYPTLSLRGGQLADLVLGPAADALAAVEHLNTVRTAAYDPYTALAAGGYDATTLNTVLAGMGVTRLPAATATGTAAFVFSTDTTRSIPAGMVLTTADGVAYKTAAARVLPSTGTAVASGDVVLVAAPAGVGYVATVAITASATGATANRSAGTSLTATTPLSGQTAVYAATDITGGADVETDAALLARLPAATAPRTAASAAGAEAVVRDAAAAVSAIGVVGFGDTGMTRGKSVLSTQTPGRMDLNIRGGAAPGRARCRVLATLVGMDGIFGSWQFTLAATSAPGWFSVEKVLQTTALLTAGGYVPTTLTYGFDTSADTDPPAIAVTTDAFGSEYATVSVKFTDPDTSTTGLIIGTSTKSYDCVVRTVPSVSAGQTAVETAGVKAAGGDCLVRAARPVMVSVTAVATAPTGVSITAAQVAAAVAAGVNATGVNPSLSGSVVGTNAIKILPVGITIRLTGWSGTVYGTDGTTNIITGTDGLDVTTDWTRGLGTNAVAFYCDPEGVTASVG